MLVIPDELPDEDPELELPPPLLSLLLLPPDELLPEEVFELPLELEPLVPDELLLPDELLPLVPEELLPVVVLVWDPVSTIVVV